MEVNVQRDYQPLFTLVQPLHTKWQTRVHPQFIQQHLQKFLASCQDSVTPTFIIIIIKLISFIYELSPATCE